MNTRLLTCAAIAGAIASPTLASETLVFQSSFDDAMPAEVAPGVAALTEVQGFAGLGGADGVFAGTFLRSPTGNVVTLTLSGLPVHDSVSVGFLFAAIDSLDGTGASPPQGDFLRVELDGAVLLRESFANATDSQIQSYVPPPGGELARKVDLGFSGPGSYFTDSAYDMNLEPRFQSVAHASPSLTLTLQIEGPGIQSLSDESWAMDNLRVSVNSACVGDVTTTSTNPGDAGYGEPDGTVDGADLSYYVEAWLASAPSADVTTTSTNPGEAGYGEPDGTVNGADLSFYVEAWLAGCLDSV